MAAVGVDMEEVEVGVKATTRSVRPLIRCMSLFGMDAQEAMELN